MIGGLEAVEAFSAHTGYVRKVWDDLWTHLTGLLGANLLFLLWCMPYALLALLQLPTAAILTAPFTVGPGVVGLMTYAGNLAKGEPASFWRDSLRGARSAFVPGAALCGVALIALSAHAIALGAATDAGMALAPLLFWASQLAILLILAMLGVHVFSFVALYRQGIFGALRNAFLLSVAHPMATLGMLGVGLLALVLIQAARWAPMIIAPAVIAVCAVNTTRMLVGHRAPKEGTENV